MDTASECENAMAAVDFGLVQIRVIRVTETIRGAMKCKDKDM